MILNSIIFFNAETKKCLLRIKTSSWWVLFSIFNLTFLLSCASVPQQTFLEKGKLSKFNVVALSVLSTDLDVQQSRNNGLWTVCTIPLLGFVAPGIEYGIRRSVDQAHTKSIKDTTGEFSTGKLLGNYFIDDMRKASRFKTINFIDHLDQNNYKNLVNEGYNATIELNIKELTLTKSIGDKLKICLDVWGEMIDLEKGETIWNRQVVTVSDEQYTLESYKAESSQILKDLIDQMLRKTARKLANDIIYLK